MQGKTYPVEGPVHSRSQPRLGISKTGIHCRRHLGPFLKRKATRKMGQGIVTNGRWMWRWWWRGGSGVILGLLTSTATCNAGAMSCEMKLMIVSKSWTTCVLYSLTTGAAVSRCVWSARAVGARFLSQNHTQLPHYKQTRRGRFSQESATGNLWQP